MRSKTPCHEHITIILNITTSVALDLMDDIFEWASKAIIPYKNDLGITKKKKMVMSAIEVATKRIYRF